MPLTSQTLALCTYATRSFCYAVQAQVPLMLANLQTAGVVPERLRFLMAGDGSPESRGAFEEITNALHRWAAGLVPLTEYLAVAEPEQRLAGHGHETASNLNIARMQDACFARARELGVDLLWSLESDVLPAPNALRSLAGALAFDGGHYAIAMAAYPNDEFLGGHGSPQQWILPSVYLEEHQAPEGMLEEFRKLQETNPAGGTEEAVKEHREKLQALEKEIRGHPPRGNAFELNARRWRRRGWLSHAYPAVGLGAVVPTDWVGMGCTLFTRAVVNLTSWTGYDGHGTQDLWAGWRVWQPAGFRMAVVTHATCSHVKVRWEEKDGSRTPRAEMLYAFHETGGEFHGHLRVQRQPFKLPAGWGGCSVIQ